MASKRLLDLLGLAFWVVLTFSVATFASQFEPGGMVRTYRETNLDATGVAVRPGVGDAVSFHECLRMVGLAPEICGGCYSAAGILPDTTRTKWNVVVALFWSSLDSVGPHRPHVSCDPGCHYGSYVSAGPKNGRVRVTTLPIMGFFCSSPKPPDLANKLKPDPASPSRSVFRMRVAK